MEEGDAYLKKGIIVIVLVVLLIVGYGSYINSASRLHIEKILKAEYAQVTVDKVQYRDLHAMLGDLNISVKSRWMVDIQAQFEGTIKEIYVNQGDKTQEGQELLLLENPDLPAQIAQIDGLIAGSLANLKASEKTMERYKQLMEAGGGISKQQYDEVIASHAVAQGELAARKAQKEALLVNQGKQVVRAPRNADVLKIYRRKGDYIRAGEAAILLGDLDQLYFRTPLPAADVKKIMPLDAEFRLKMDVHSLQYKTYQVNLKTHPLNYEILLRVVEVEPDVSIPSPYRYIIWAVQSGMGLLEPTTYRGVSIVAQQGRKALAISRHAIEDPLNPQVLLVGADGILQLKTVKTGIWSDEYVEVLEGLSANDIVVVSDRRGLKTGTRVRVTHE